MSTDILELAVRDGLDVAADGPETAEGSLVVVGCGQGVSGVLTNCPADEHGQVVAENVGGLDGAEVRPGVGAVCLKLSYNTKGQVYLE